MLLRHIFPLILIANAALTPEDAALPTSQLSDKANALLSSGSNLSRAIDIFDLLISRDAQDYLSLYKRATAYMAISQSKRALDDFEAVLRIADFDQARLQLVKIRLKTGDVDAARLVLKPYAAKKGPSDPIVKDVEAQISNLATASKAARLAHKNRVYDECVLRATDAISIATQSPDLQQLKADCLLSTGHLEDAAGEMSRAASLNPSDANLMSRLALLNYVYLSTETAIALAPIKQCLHYDPDSPACKKLFKRIKAIDKDVNKARNFIESSRWASAASLVDPKINLDEGLIHRVRILAAEATKDDAHLLPASLRMAQSKLLVDLYSWACQAHLRAGQTMRASKTCETLRSLKADDTYALWAHGLDQMKGEEWEQAVRSLQQAFENTGRQDREILEALQKAQGGLKRSKNKDYYKILSVSHDADDRTIKKAFRKAVLKAHPDKGGSDQKMAAVNEAYEVLSNPELRARFDRGDDPNDSSQQQPFASHFHPGAAHHVFQQFFQQQQGGSQGGQQFHFQWG